MKHRILTFLLAGALLASAVLNVTLARSCGGCALCGQPSPAQLQDCVECLAMTPEQCEAMMAQCGSCCSDATSCETRITALQAELQQALRKTPPDADAVRELASEIARLRGDAIVAGAETALKVRALLTPAQLAAMDRSLGPVVK